MTGSGFSPNSFPEFWTPQEQPSPSFLNLVLDTPQAGPSGHQQQQQDQTNDDLDKATPRQSPQDVDMGGTGADAMDTRQEPDATSDPNASAGQRARAKALGRSKYRDLNWNAHKATMKVLYMDKDMSLKETMDIMEREHSFEAS